MNRASAVVMILADYEELIAADGFLLWLLLTFVAGVVGLVGVCEAVRRKGERGVARWLGIAATLLEIVGMAAAWAFYYYLQGRREARVVALARPEVIFWVVSGAALLWTGLSIFLSRQRCRGR